MIYVSHIIKQLLFTTGVSLALFQVQVKNYPGPTISDLFVGERESHIFHEWRQDDSDREFYRKTYNSGKLRLQWRIQRGF